MITITGTGFTGATGVKFGTTSATSYTVVSATSVKATSPAEAAGTVNITVLIPGGNAVGASLFTFKAVVPSVTGVSPAIGSPAGGTHVTLTGTNFTGVSAVKFGTTPATSYTVTSTTTIKAVAPAGAATTTVHVRVTTSGGSSSATSAASDYTYGPYVTYVSPTAGSHLGGTKVTIVGAGFTGTTAVNFGSVAVTSGITVNAAGTQITVKSPAQAAGKVQVTVTVGLSTTSKTNTSDGFTYS